MQETRYATCHEIIVAEYGDSRNPMTPNVITFGGVLHGPHPWAAEIATGEGITPGTSICGVSVVLVNEDGTTRRSHELSQCFSEGDVNVAVDAALDYLRTLDDAVHELRSFEQAHEVAHKLGHEAGVAAGSWLLDGNSSEEAAKRLLTGIEDGDPEILDALPHSPLSGEWADGPTPDDVVREVEAEVEIVVDEDSRDDVLRSYEDGFSEGVTDEAVRSARAMLGSEEVSA